MPPEIEVWKRIVIGQVTYTRFYIKCSTPDVLFCVTPRSPMLRSAIDAANLARWSAAERRQLDEQARRIRKELV